MIERFKSTPVMHRAVAHGDVLYVSGIFASNTAAGMEGQTADALERIGTVLAAHGSGKDKVLVATAYVTDLSMKEAMNKAWAAFFEPAYMPARATIGVNDLGPNILIEIVVTAAL